MKYIGKPYGIGSNPRGGVAIQISAEELAGRLGLRIVKGEIVSQIWTNEAMTIDVNAHQMLVSFNAPKGVWAAGETVWRSPIRNEFLIPVRLTWYTEDHTPVDGGPNPLAVRLERSQGYMASDIW